MHTVMAFYAFADWPEFAAHREAIFEVCQAKDIKGTILLAAEGINGTVAGPEAGVQVVLEQIRSIGPFAGLTPKFSQAEDSPFPRLKVRLKNEIVTLGIEELDPTDTGTHVAPEEWDDLISDPDVVLIDARNAYEIAIGKFPNAIDPGTESFRDFPEWLASAPVIADKPKIAMYCTCVTQTAGFRRGLPVAWRNSRVSRCGARVGKYVGRRLLRLRWARVRRAGSRTGRLRRLSALQPCTRRRGTQGTGLPTGCLVWSVRRFDHTRTPGPVRRAAEADRTRRRAWRNPSRTAIRDLAAVINRCRKVPPVRAVRP